MQIRQEFDIDAMVRAITDEEVEFYIENGWVKLPRLVDPELALAMLEIGRLWSSDVEWDKVGAAMSPSKDVEPFGSFVLNRKIGEAAQRLFNRKRLSDVDVAAQFSTDVLMCKIPGAKGHSFHQDSCEHAQDRVGEMTFWLALDTVTPEMGAMRFLSGSHREGALGTAFGAGVDLITYYPKLEDLYEWSPPLSYEPGDVTVHDGFMIHGGPDNTTDKERWSYLFLYAPRDTRWVGGEFKNWGIDRLPLSDETYPIVSG